MCFLFLCVFALLVSNTAGSFASGLAGCLAFAATAVFNALLEVAGSESLNSLHDCSSEKIYFHNDYTATGLKSQQFCEIWRLT